MSRIDELERTIKLRNEELRKLMDKEHEVITELNDAKHALAMEQMKMFKVPTEWKNAVGEFIEYADMDDSYLLNIMKMYAKDYRYAALIAVAYEAAGRHLHPTYIDPSAWGVSRDSWESVGEHPDDLDDYDDVPF